MGFEGIGASVRRKEDARFLNGRGNYTDDINRPGQLHAYVKRSDRPHAKINSIDSSAAAKAPGVVAVFTALLAMATGLVVARSESVNSRPPTSGMRSVSK